MIGAVAGYLVAVDRLLGLQARAGKEGMGYGDFKLLAAIGALARLEDAAAGDPASSVVGAVVGIC